MASIRVKSIGPLQDTGVIELRTFNVFIGKQSTGKSTLLKIMSHCRWVEKLMCVGKPRNGRGVRYAYTHYYRFIQELIKFYRVDPKFLSPESEIWYEGDSFRIIFKGTHNANARIEQIEGATPYNAKLCFIPSERNLISAIRDIESWYRPKDFDVLFNFIFEWDEVRDTYTPANALPLVVTPNVEYFYDKNRGEQLRLTDKEKEISPFYASSGIQSALPLEVMVNALVKSVGSKANLSKTDLMDIVAAILKEDKSFSKDSIETNISANLLTYKSASFFIEEPEQNLFPESQAKLLRHMVGAIKLANSKSDNPRSSISIATHSPYILSALNVLMAASEAYEKDPAKTIGIVPDQFILPRGEVGAYCISEDGKVQDLINPDIYMIDGTYLDHASQRVEDDLDRLNDIICS